jgi:hypothetical protein
MVFAAAVATDRRCASRGLFASLTVGAAAAIVGRVGVWIDIADLDAGVSSHF